MDLELFILNGYGRFVWPSFIFTITICFYLYLKTKQNLQKLEKLFLKEFYQLQDIKIVTKSQKENKREVLSGNSIF